jgi:hypothetical protein
MTSPLDNAVVIGKESVYGTPATLTRAYEAKGDGWKRNQAYIDSKGFRGGYKALRSNRHRRVNMGAEGKLEADVLTNGFGLLLEALLGTSTAPAQQGATTAYEQVHSAAVAAPADSYTVQVQRYVVDAASTQQFTYHGSVTTGYKLSCEVGGLLALEATFDAEDEDTITAKPGALVYPDGDLYDWSQGVVTIGGTPVDLASFEVEADHNLATDRRFLSAGGLKKRPQRKGLPEYKGKVSGEFRDLTLYNAFVNGTVLSFKAEFTGALIESTYYNKVTVECPAVQFDGETPQAELEELTKIELPFTVLDNETDAPVIVTLVSTDTAF